MTAEIISIDRDDHILGWWFAEGQHWESLAEALKALTEAGQDRDDIVAYVDGWFHTEDAS